MAQLSLASVQSAHDAPSPGSGLSTMEPSATHLSTLLQVVDSSAQKSNAAYENRLVEVRLGVASGLFTALRHKHAPAAAHSLRVALGCSSWAFALGLPAQEREELEIASLLHDVGKIGAPDCLLLKPGALAGEEATLMDQYRLAGLDILGTCCPSEPIIEIIRHSAGWLDGSRDNYPLVGTEIPAGARMLAIVDAFDSMTTDQVYRRAMSRERALHELFSHSGSQFDPELVKSFSELQITAQLHRKVVGHWLQTIDPLQASRNLRQNQETAIRPASSTPSRELIFQQKLLDNMYDAVIFVDRTMQIILWNRGAERLTGIAASSVIHRNWSPSLIGMRDEKAAAGEAFDCPVAYAVESGVQSLRRLLVANRNNRPIAVDLHTIPVVNHDGTTFGTTLLLHDASGEATLEERCQSLHEKATKDPLTQVANRAEFDRTHQLFVIAHVEHRLPCSLIMCDIDHFKSVNDTYGHQAGDEVLKFFGQLLKSECRPGDLVARYGGEEFVMLCTDCDNASAASRAEQLRKRVSEMPHSQLAGNQVTVSFGVTGIQAGDTPDSMLRRADRALLEAKRAGRNVVVQLGNGLGGDGADFLAEPAMRNGSAELFVERLLVSAVPLNIAIEKIKGFMLDHHAEVLSINANRIALQIEAERRKPTRRRSDRPIPFLVELALSEQRVPSTSVDGRSTGQLSRTHVQVGIRLKNLRDRRIADAALQASSILAAIKSYLMATEESGFCDRGASHRAANVLASWFKWRK